MDEGGCYGGMALVVGGVAFLCFWAYAVATYGWFLGLGLGWIPAAFLGVLAGLLWPLVLLAALGVAWMIWGAH
jgi:hypothetical protein